MKKNGPAQPIAPVRGRLFRAGEAAEYLGMTESRVRALVARGELVALRSLQGRLQGIYEQDCDAWILQRRRAQAPVAPVSSVDERVKQLLPKDQHFT